MTKSLGYVETVHSWLGGGGLVPTLGDFGLGARGPVLTSVPSLLPSKSLEGLCGRYTHLLLLLSKCSYQEGVTEATPVQFLEWPPAPKSKPLPQVGCLNKKETHAGCSGYS